MTQEKMQQLQRYEQSMQALLQQKQQFQSQITEMDSALEQLKDAPEAYNIIGNIMVKAKKEVLEKDLQDKKKQMELRITALEKQEETIKNKATSLREELMEGMKDES